MILFLLSLSPCCRFKDIFVFSEMHYGKAQVRFTINLCPRFNPRSPELTPGCRSNSGPYRFMDIDWLISVGSLVSTCLARWFNLFNHNPLEEKDRGRIWLIRTQALQILWASVHILTHAFNNFGRPYGRQSFLHRWEYCWKCEFDTDVKIE